METTTTTSRSRRTCDICGVPDGALRSRITGRWITADRSQYHPAAWQDLTGRNGEYTVQTVCDRLVGGETRTMCAHCFLLESARLEQERDRARTDDVPDVDERMCQICHAYDGDPVESNGRRLGYAVVRRRGGRYACQFCAGKRRRTW